MSSAADPGWDRLTSPAKAGWRWAWAVAIARTDTGEPSDVQVDTTDLLAGLVLAQLRDNPAGQLLTHFQIPPGVLLGDGGARRYRVEVVLAAANRVPDDALPPVDEPAGQVLVYAFDSMPPRSDGLVTLSMLFGALLETPNPVSTALRPELANRDVDVEAVLQSCRAHLDARVSYAEYLRSRHPYRPPEALLAPLVSDEPRTRRPPSRSDADPRDLFGDWGSGKSYFLRSVQRRIDELADPQESPTPFYRAIAQGATPGR